jgi:hypothetical protein
MPFYVFLINASEKEPCKAAEIREKMSVRGKSFLLFIKEGKLFSATFGVQPEKRYAASCHDKA